MPIALEPSDKPLVPLAICISRRPTLCLRFRREETLAGARLMNVRLRPIGGRHWRCKITTQGKLPPSEQEVAAKALHSGRTLWPTDF